MRASSRRLFVGVGALALGLPLLAALAAPSVSATTTAITFSHGVPTDEQRPGFEPDIVVDNNHVGTDDGQRLYSSVPFGFSTTQSFLYESRDSGETFRLAPGNLAGKPTTCVGGGDTELQLDANGAIFFSDLQGLTNLSNSVSTDHGAHFVTNCAAAPNTPVDRMWYAHTGTLAGGNLNLYEEYDAVASALPSTNNQLVETISHDGVTFAPLVNANLSADCAGFGAANCVTDNEGLPGNQIVDPASGDIFITHTAPGSSTNGIAPQVMVERGHLSSGTPTTVTWTHIGPINAPLCPDPTCTDASGNAEVIAAENFPVIAEDSAHHFYVTFATTRVNSAGAPTGPEQIYVVSSADGTHWGTPVKVASSGTNTFPWIVAGDSGRVDLAWYHTNTTSDNGQYGASALLNAEWTVQFGQSLNAAGSTPSYTIRTATEHSIKHGQICTSGLGCTTGGDRSLGDFMEITADAHGGAIISYVDDTSNIYSGGEAAGPAEIVRQISGPSLRTATPTVSRIGPGQNMNSTGDDTGDAVYSANGSDTPASSNLDLTGAALSQDSSGNVIATIKLKTLSSLLPSPTSGGTDAGWLIRWTVVTPGTPGNGHIYYAGMDSSAGGAPHYFDGDVGCVQTTHCKYFTYSDTHSIHGSYSPSTGVITLTVPKADVGNPAAGTTFYSALGFTETSLTPLSQPSLFNVIDATQPFDYVVK